MTAIPVFETKFAKGWPVHAVGDAAAYTPIASALVTAFGSDAHFATYSVPEIGRRLADASVFDKLAAGAPIVLFVVDAEPAKHAPVTPEWWAAERAKLDQLLALHPGGYVYRTRGGYRVVYLLAAPVVLRSTEDAEAWKARYLAWLDYLLTPDTRQQKIAMLIGPKRSGKGTIARIVAALLGNDSVAAPTLASLGTNFGLQPLIGRTAAIIGDARLSGRSDIAVVVERLLSLSGEDTLTIDRKFREAWTGRLRTRLTIISNELPRFTDASDALSGRMLLLELQRSWFGQEDHGLEQALLAEMPGILLWAIDGWQRLRDRGRFVQPAASAESIDELTDLASPVAAWARYRCKTDERDPQWWITCDFAFSDYCTWAEKNGHHKPSQTTFGRDIKAATGCPRKEIRRDGGKVRVYRGLALR